LVGVVNPILKISFTKSYKSHFLTEPLSARVPVSQCRWDAIQEKQTKWCGRFGNPDDSMAHRNSKQPANGAATGLAYESTLSVDSYGGGKQRFSVDCPLFRLHRTQTYMDALDLLYQNQRSGAPFTEPSMNGDSAGKSI
jgi:hypothetical protein